MGYPGSGAGILDTVIAHKNGGDCDSQFTSFDLGHNMDSDGTCLSTSTQSTDKPNTEPGLGNPGDNGGPLVGNTSDGSAVVTRPMARPRPTLRSTPAPTPVARPRTSVV